MCACSYSMCPLAFCIQYVRATCNLAVGRSFSSLCQGILLELQCAHPALPGPHELSPTDGSNNLSRRLSPPATSSSLSSTESCQRLTLSLHFPSWFLFSFVYISLFFAQVRHFFPFPFNSFSFGNNLPPLNAIPALCAMFP